MKVTTVALSKWGTNALTTMQGQMRAHYYVSTSDCCIWLRGREGEREGDMGRETEELKACGFESFIALFSLVPWEEGDINYFTIKHMNDDADM